MPDEQRLRLIVKLPMPSTRTKSLHPSIRSGASGASEQINAASAPRNIKQDFSQSQLAIALSITKSRPEGLSSKEYIQQLRKHVKVGQPTPRDELRYIDTTEFWKDQFTRLQLEKKALQDENHCLKEAQRLSRKRHHSNIEQDVAQDSQGVMDMSSAGQSQFQASEADLVQTNDDYLRLSSYALRIGRHRTALETITIDSGSLDNINAHWKQILQVLALLDLSLPNCCLPTILLKDSNENAKVSFEFQQFMKQFTLAFLACLSAIDDLCRTIPGRTKKGEIVYRAVMLFKQGLDLLQTICTDQASFETNTRRHGQGHKKQKTNVGEYLVNKYLTKALAAVAQNAEWKVRQPAHCEILEGFLFSILEHTGRLLSEAVFGEHVATSELPGNIVANGDPVELGVVKPEARYIVQVLHATAGAGNRNGMVTQMLAAGKAPLNAQLRTENIFSADIFGDLLSKSKRLLQSTLMKSAIGGADLESLRLPTPPLEMSDAGAEIEVEKYGKDWLVEIVWGLIGWDLVCSK